MNPLALEALTKNQRQLDQDGVEVGVSRQALDELLTAYGEARSKLFPYADATEISGMSWNGFYLIGDSKSITEFRRVEHRAAQLEEFRRAFDERIAFEKARAERAEAAAAEKDAALRKAVSLIDAMMANDPNEPISDAGHVALDLWKHEAEQIRAALPPAPDAALEEGR